MSDSQVETDRVPRPSQTAECRQPTLIGIDVTPSRRAKDHDWRYVGQESPSRGGSALHECRICRATMRVTRRWKNALTTYSLDGKSYAKQRPVCSTEGPRGA